MRFKKIKNKILKIYSPLLYIVKFRNSLNRIIRKYLGKTNLDLLKNDICKYDGEFAMHDISEKNIHKFKNSCLHDYHKYLGSFRYEMNRLTKKQRYADNELNWKIPEFTLDEKILSYKLSDRLNLLKPKIFKFDRFANLELSDKIVVKPEKGAGSKNVFIIINPEKIYDCRKNEFINEILLQSADDVKYYQMEYIYYNRNLNSIRELKFYTFYGYCPLVLEVYINLTKGEKSNTFYNRRGKIIDVGKYNVNEKNNEREVNLKQFKLAEEVSDKIPTPFMRVDFIDDGNNLYFNEFSPRPGDFCKLNDIYDNFLGSCYIEAEQRLMRDLLNRKKFKEFHGVTDEKDVQ